MSANPSSQDAAAEPALPSAWTEYEIPRRKGNCKILLIAPHGHRKNDGRTYSITRLAADTLDSYAIVNKTYRKPPVDINENGKRVRHTPDKSKKWVNLNRKNQVEPHLEAEFKEPLIGTVDEIIQRYGNAIVIWIHGIDDNNLTPANTEGDRRGMDALIGIGQGEPNRPTANKKTVEKLIKCLSSNSAKPIKAALAKKGSDYCGWHENIMNQFFRDDYGRDKVESIQIEIKKTGFRESGKHAATTAEAIADAIATMTDQKPQDKTEQSSSDSAVQNATIQEIKAGEIDFNDGQFKSRIDEIDSNSVEFYQLVESIRKNGILNNIIVRKRSSNDGKPYQLISGFRRMIALKASKNDPASFEDEPIWARVLDATVSNDDAYRISFTENLARKDLSVWEVAQACAEIKKNMLGSGKAKGVIEDHIANLIQKNPRTVRRYLKLAAIKNEDLADAVHNGSINYLDALEIGENDLEADDITALLGHLQVHPKPTRAFKQFYENLEYCRECSEMPLSAVLACKNADGFLSLENEELFARVEHLRDKTDKGYPDILKGKAGSLIKDTGEIDAGLEKKETADKFKKTNKDIVDKVLEAFRKTNVDGKFKIKPAAGFNDNHVTVTITVPKDQIWQAFDAASKAKNRAAAKVIRRIKPKAAATKQVTSENSDPAN